LFLWRHVGGVNGARATPGLGSTIPVSHGGARVLNSRGPEMWLVQGCKSCLPPSNFPQHVCDSSIIPPMQENTYDSRSTLEFYKFWPLNAASRWKSSLWTVEPRVSSGVAHRLIEP
jgi:hypothetical protein